jgi:hypothetical protein
MSGNSAGEESILDAVSMVQVETEENIRTYSRVVPIQYLTSGQMENLWSSFCLGLWKYFKVMKSLKTCNRIEQVK